jgi:hypothetical protein
MLEAPLADQWLVPGRWDVLHFWKANLEEAEKKIRLPPVAAASQDGSSFFIKTFPLRQKHYLEI